MREILHSSKHFVVCLSLLSFISLQKYLGICFWASSYTMLLLEIVLLSLCLCWPSIKFIMSSNNRQKIFKDKNWRYFNLFFIYTLLISIYSLVSIHNREELLFYINSSTAIFWSIIVYIINPRSLLFFYNKSFYKVMLFVFIIFFPIWKFYEGIGYLLAIFLLLILFWGEVKSKKRFFLLGMAMLVFFICFFSYARSHCVKIGSLLLLGFIFSYYRSIFLKLYRTFGIVFLTLPFVFLFMSFYFNFNVFEWMQGQDYTEGLHSDTRTGIYTEVLMSAQNNNSFILGRGFHHGYDSIFQFRRQFGINGGFLERLSESQILNYFTHGGVIYVLFFLILCISTFYKTIKSNNDYIKLLGVYVCFIWFYSWVELPITVGTTSIFIWIVFGICLSVDFRNMNNKDFFVYINKYLL